jgi:hypothetical protein
MWTAIAMTWLESNGGITHDSPDPRPANFLEGSDWFATAFLLHAQDLEIVMACCYRFADRVPFSGYYGQVSRVCDASIRVK